MMLEIDLPIEGKLIGDLFECKGRMTFKVYNLKNQILIECSYINSLDTLKKYSISKSAING